MVNLRRLGAFLLLIVCSHACKQKDELPPTVIISQPLAQTNYNVFDTVWVEVMAFDNQQLTAVEAKIVDINFIPITTTVPIHIHNSNASGTAALVIDDKRTPTADYYVLVIAYDGTNEQRAYQKIKIVEVAKQRRAVFFGTTTGFKTGQLWRIDSLFQQAQPWLNLNQDIAKICVNSLSDRLNVVGYLSSTTASYTIPTATQAWAAGAFLAAQTPRYLDLCCFENTIFTALYDNQVNGFQLSGAPVAELHTENFRPHTLYADKEFLVVQMEHIGDDDFFLFVYSNITHSLLWQIDIPMQVAAICELQSGQLLLFGNENGNAKVLHYNIHTNAYWQPRELPIGYLYDAVKLNGQNVAIAHQNGLYTYRYSPNYLNLMKPGAVYQSVVFDADKQNIIGASQNTLHELTTSGQVLQTIIHTDSIASVDIHYTR